MLAFLETALVLFVAFILQGLRRIHAEPPHAGIRTIGGERDATKPVVKEGWRFFPIYPYWHGVIVFNVEKVDFDMPEQRVRTPDMAELSVPVSITWTPDTDSAEALINFQNSGEHDGVNGLLTNVVKERLRIWAISGDEGPQTWKEGMQAGEEASTIILKALLGDILEKIPSDVPTHALMKFLAEHRKKPTTSEAKTFGPNWEILKAKWDNLPPEKQNEIKAAIAKRRAEIKTASEGNGKFKLLQFGIKINKLNIGEIKVLGEVARVAELVAKEAREQEAEVVELKHIAKRIRALKALKMSNEQAIEIIQTERAKVIKNISEHKLNISEETRKMFEQIAPNMLAAIFSQKGGQQ